MSGVLVLLLLVHSFTAWTFIVIMYDGQVNNESLVEAASYATQTMTTVGYGNWETPALGIKHQDHAKRVLQMRGWSALHMLFGASFYAYIVGAIVSMTIPSRDA